MHKVFKNKVQWCSSPLSGKVINNFQNIDGNQEVIVSILDRKNINLVIFESKNNKSPDLDHITMNLNQECLNHGSWKRNFMDPNDTYGKTNNPFS